MLPTTHKTNSNHCSDAYSSILVHTRNTFDIEEPNTKTKIWFKWFKTRISQYMILEVFVVISLIWIFYRLETISNQNDRVLEMVNSMHSQLGNMERKIELLVSRKPNQDISQSDNTKPLGQPIADVLNNMKVPTQNSTEKVEPIVPQVKQAIPNTKEKDPFRFNVLKNMKLPTQEPSEKMEQVVQQVKQSTSQTTKSNLKVSLSKEPFRFNAADYLRGASVDRYDSSRSNLVKPFSLDQSNLVILDRPQPPADKAWCSTAKNPVLTIDLAEYIKPISVTYQHSKWNGTIPNGAPKTYDVLACLDCDRDGWKPLAMNCQYSQYGSKEQSCNMLSYQDVLLIRKVQFRFRKNYGDTNRTCVSLVRVYGETKKPVKIEQKPLNSKETCADLKRYYHNSYFGYIWAEKNCTVLYKNNCCSECPECCQECLISNYDKYFFADFFELWGALIVMLLFFCILGCLPKR
ncbi:unnamed protein product [Caenorhabditis nigoni]